MQQGRTVGKTQRYILDNARIVASGMSLQLQRLQRRLFREQDQVTGLKALRSETGLIPLLISAATNARNA